MNRLLLLALALPLSMPAQDARPAVTVPRLAEPVVIDGALDEPVWAKAVRLDGFHQYLPSDGRPAQEQTEILVWYAPEALVVGIKAHAADASSLRADGDGRTLYINHTLSTASASSRLRVDWLASYQPTPGTVAFLGYGTGLDAPRADEYSALRRSDDAVFVKLAYQFRR